MTYVHSAPQAQRACSETGMRRDPKGLPKWPKRPAVHFTSSDGAATLLANYTFVGGDGGVHSFSATLITVGTWSITATDTVTGSITGTQSGIVVN